MRRVRDWPSKGEAPAAVLRSVTAPDSRALLPDLLVILTLLAMIWASIWVNLARERDNALDVARRTADNAAGAAEQVISRTVEAVDQHILFVRDAFRRDRLGFSLDFLRESRAPGRPTLQIAIIDASGRLVATDRGPAPPTDLSDRAHFRAHLGDAPDALFISVPVLGRESGRWSVQFTRRLVDEDGRFAGVVVGSLDPQWLTHLHGTLDVGRGVLTLMGRDGVVRARAPQAPGALGSDMRGTPLFDAVMRSDRGSLFTISPLDGTERLVAFRHVADHPLIVMAGRDAADIYAGFEAFRARALAAGAALTALVLLAGWLLIRHKRQQLGSQRALSDAVENISQGLIMVDAQGRVPVLNRRVAELLGLPAALLAGQPSFAAIRRWQIESGEFGAPGALPTGTFGPVDEVVPTPPTPEGAPSVYERVRPNGTVLEIRTSRLKNGGAVRTYTDITERRRAEERVLFLAHHDALTGLANRFALRDRLERALARAAPGPAGGVAVLALDLDRFKAVNDAMGHAAGDALLAQVAGRLRGCVRAADTVARLGGDEFVVMQPGATLGDAETVARRVVAALSEPFLLDGQEARVGTSVGIALAPPAAPEADALLRDADTALYRAKAEGRGTIRVFEPGMGARRRARRRMEHELRRALEEPEGTGGLVLHFQPIFERRGRRVAACEALLRWTHPERGAIPPGEFIAVAEESGLIQPLGRWVLRAACAAAASWPGQQRVAVNVSPAQLRAGDLAELVAGTLRDTGLPARRLELEVTEGLLIQDTEGALAAIRALKVQGVEVALDDFGTGYSSLAYLHRFPFDRVKVDRSFVAALEEDDGARAIIRAILSMSTSLGLAVTAEGVETPGQREFLDAHGCDELQGFLLARPMPAAELAALLDREARNGEQAAA